MQTHTIQHGNEVYQFKELMHFGGVGGVYNAVEKVSQKEVVIKVFVLPDLHTKLQFENEISITKKLSGLPHFPVVVGAFRSNNKGYLITEKLAIDLFILIRHTLSESAIRNIFCQLCEAVKTCHEHKIAHLDIKPENILLDEKGTVILCDFGHSMRFKKGIPEVIETRGTPVYRSPEVNRQELLRPDFSDVWSLGMVLHLMVTSKLPYKASTIAEMKNCLNNETLCFSALQTSPVSREVKHLIWRMLQPNPMKRISVERILLHPWLLANHQQ